MNTTQPIEAKPTGPSGKIWGLWQSEEIIADAMHQDEAEHFARLHNQSLLIKYETFKAHGLTWIKHVPGDPTPCDDHADLRVLFRSEKRGDYAHGVELAYVWDWDKDCGHPGSEIIGWNYADAP